MYCSKSHLTFNYIESNSIYIAYCRYIIVLLIQTHNEVDVM